jgi:putative FmdB family regulatory protein
MPIYAYRCAACGHARDVLQKIADAVLSVCPACGAGSFEKQVTAAGFQLKGSGWYATDFRGGSNGAAKPEGDASAATDPAKAADKPADKAVEKAAEKPADKPADKTAASPAPAAPPAAGG